jgi:hypothetical protein
MVARVIFAMPVNVITNRLFGKHPPIRKYRTGVLQHRGEAAILSAITSAFDMGAKGA